MEAAVTGSEAEGLYGLLRGQYHTPLYPHPHLLPKSLTMPPLPPFPIHPSGVQGTRSLSSCRAGTGIYLFNCPFSFRGRDPCQHATPSYSVGGIKRVYRCQVEGCKEGPSAPHATICVHPNVQGILGGGVGVPPLQQILLQP